MRLRIGAAVLLLAAVPLVGVGCTGQPPATEHQAQQQAQSIGAFFFFLIYSGMCQANGGECPFPLGPSDPVGP